MDAQLTIQQVSDQTGLSEYTLRYYENIGLIECVSRAENGHRRYTADDIGWIEFLKCLRATGMPVAQMRQYAELVRSGQDTVTDRLALLEDHRDAVLNQIDELRRFLAVLDHKIDYYSKEKGLIEDAERTRTFGN
jgi:DNA-binding transcriptional MerR regulator